LRKFYEDEVAENARIAEIAEKTVLPAHAKRAFESAYDRIKREERKATLIRVCPAFAFYARGRSMHMIKKPKRYSARRSKLATMRMDILFGRHINTADGNGILGAFGAGVKPMIGGGIFLLACAKQTETGWKNLIPQNDLGLSSNRSSGHPQNLNSP
jgi:hypothetical protein